MKIALLTDGIYPWVMGGMQKHSYFLARYLARNGIRVSLFHCIGKEDQIPHNNGADPKFFRDEELENLDFWCVRWPGKKKSIPGHYLRENRKYSELIYKELRKRIQDFDLIYTQGFTGWECIKARTSGELHTPVLVNFHGLEMFQKPPSFRVKLEHLSLRPATRWNLIHADYVMSFGGKITDILKQVGIDSKKIIELPNGIEEDWLVDHIPKKEDELRRFVFMGRYERRKGIEELHTALRTLLKNQNLSFEFHFVGPIPKKKQINNSKIIYHGMIRQPEQIESILEKCDVLVCPSHSEGMPTVILEAMAKGLAILASDVGAVESMIHDNGWLIPPNQLNNLDKWIENINAERPDELKEKKSKSIQLVKDHFSWNRVAELTMQKLKEITS